MASDWIKMRTDLYRDPKVCVIADLLMDPDGDLSRYVNQHCQRDMTVTRNVMRNVTVGSLVSVWGVMRVRGKCDGDDLVCNGVTTSVIDDIADLPGFGAAMVSVGWVVETPEGLVFPRFFEDYNVDPEASSKAKAAERQARYRERQKAKSDASSDVTRDVTVTHREEKSREEKSKEEPKSKAVGALASRLPTDWEPNELEVAFCRTERPDLVPDSVASQFRDYWIAQPGAKGRKADWAATWRNWVRNQRGAIGRPQAMPSYHDERANVIAELTGANRRMREQQGTERGVVDVHAKRIG